MGNPNNHKQVQEKLGMLDEMDMENAVHNLNIIRPYIMASQKQGASLMFNYFNELVEAGFTVEQAMQIVICHGYTPKSSS